MLRAAATSGLAAPMRPASINAAARAHSVSASAVTSIVSISLGSF
jgi:hypothetical protein